MFQDIPISNLDIQEYLSYFSDKPFNYIHVNDLPNMDMDSVFDADEKRVFAVIFVSYPGQQVGHWIVLLNRGDDEIELFDSLSLMSVYSEILDPIVQFAKKVNKSLTFNSIPLQSKDSNVWSRWVCLRVLLAYMTNREFIDFVLRSVCIKGVKKTLSSAQLKKTDKFVATIIRFVKKK